MNDRILEFSERELVRQIIEHAVDFKFNAVESNCRTGHERELLRQVVKQAEASGADVIKSIRDAGCYLPFLEVPVIGLKYFPDDSDTSEVRQRVVRALARAWEFYQEGHGVLLPLRPENCQIMQNADDIELNLVGMFGSSLYDGGWDDRHPTFAPFVSGVMACELTPDEIRNDPKLQEGFPPQRLEGFADEALAWWSPEVWAAHRKNAENIAAWEAKRVNWGPADYEAERRTFFGPSDGISP
jgi:hypothetical protein